MFSNIIKLVGPLLGLVGSLFGRAKKPESSRVEEILGDANTPLDSERAAAEARKKAEAKFGK